MLMCAVLHDLDQPEGGCVDDSLATSHTLPVTYHIAVLFGNA